MRKADRNIGTLEFEAVIDPAVQGESHEGEGLIKCCAFCRVSWIEKL